MPAVNLKAATKVYCSIFFDLNVRCLLCGQAPGGLLCHPCLSLLAPIEPPVCRCGLPHAAPLEDQDEAPLCGRCLRRPPAFSASQSPLQYRFPLDLLIRRYKHHGDLVAERAIEQLLARAPLPWPDTDALCPLPAHWRRRWRRGFDQSERLARRLASLWDRPLLSALQRQRFTPMQQGLSRRQRQRNLRQAFRPVKDVRGLRLVLVDDVMTTGSSARAAADCLLKQGAAEVRVWTLARTPAP
ncbi:MAG: ComF family protein [Pseudomonadales bacterium]|nr:ComF family protein [Pseudomonadales bacterium]